MWGEKFSEVRGGCSVQTVMGVQEDFKLNAKDGSDVLMFTHLHQDPGSAVLNILEPLKALVRDSNEECVTIIQPGGDKGILLLRGREMAKVSLCYKGERRKSCRYG